MADSIPYGLRPLRIVIVGKIRYPDIRMIQQPKLRRLRIPQTQLPFIGLDPCFSLVTRKMQGVGPVAIQCDTRHS